MITIYMLYNFILFVNCKKRQKAETISSYEIHTNLLL